MFRVIFLILLTIFSSLAVATDYIMIPHVKAGLIQAGWDMNDVKAKLKPHDYKRSQEIENDGGVLEVLTLFPNSKNRLMVELSGKDNNLTLGKTCQIGSLWKTTSNLKVGSSLAEVEAVNGRSVIISGWGWDFGGEMTSNRGGYYDGPMLWFSQPAKLTEKYMGDMSIDSNLLANRENIYIKCIWVRLKKAA